MDFQEWINNYFGWEVNLYDLLDEDVIEFESMYEEEINNG